MANPFQKAMDFFSGTSRVDNSKNPASAYSMMMRKTKSKGKPLNFK